jgi:hypothetical protein
MTVLDEKGVDGLPDEVLTWLALRAYRCGSRLSLALPALLFSPTRAA